MRIRWTPAAASDLENIKDYLLRHQARLAHPTVIKLRDAIRSLKTMPHRGRIGREEGTRELLVTPMPYIVAYRVKRSAIEVLRIWHSAQERP